MFNKQISDMFLRIADALEIKGENVFKIRAYRTAGQNIMGLSRQLLELFEEDPGEIDNIEGIGKDLKEKIIELLMTGGLKYYEDLRAEFPEGFLDMLKLSGLGPKKLKKLHERLGIENVDDLEKSCRRGDLENLEGMGVKTQEKFIEAIGYFREQVGRMLLPEADKCADEVLKYLLRSKYFKKIEKAGSLRRGKETIGDLDVLAQAGDREKAMDFFVKYPEVREVVAKGHTKSSVILKNGTQIDLRIVESKSFGAALVYFTGSKEHNVKIRSIAKRKGYKLNEYGVFFESGGKEKYIAGKTEKDVYAAIDLEWIPPELRENRGEIEVSQKNSLPKDLLEPKDIKGDLHMHSTKSDGSNTLEDMIRATRERGYKYLAITDHSQLIKVARGMNEKELLKRADEVRGIAKKIKDIKVLMGVEVDVLGDGTLDLKDYALKEMDIVIAAIHSKFSLDKEAQTERVLKAMDNKYVNILAHPSGRLITTRSPLKLDFDKIFKKAVQKNIFLEINTHGERIDLNDKNCRRAKELGAKFVINTDAHSVEQLSEMKYGVITARRGGLVKNDVLNTYSLDKMLRAIKR